MHVFNEGSHFHFLGAPVTFPVQVRPANNFPIDLYLLMDLSLSMKDDLENLKRLGTELGIVIIIIVNQLLIFFFFSQLNVFGASPLTSKLGLALLWIKCSEVSSALTHYCMQ